MNRVLDHARNLTFAWSKVRAREGVAITISGLSDSWVLKVVTNLRFKENCEKDLLTSVDVRPFQ